MCKDCLDIFNLSKNEKTCSCKKVKGLYINHIEVEYSGEPILIGFNNSSLRISMKNAGTDFIAFTVKPTCLTFKKKI